MSQSGSYSGSHTERFSGRVQAYVRYRPGFPREILNILREHDALAADAAVADIGAGTGMLAEIFLKAGHRVLAVEPNREMLAACHGLAGRYPTLQAIEGSAEATTLADSSVDLIRGGARHALVRGTYEALVKKRSTVHLQWSLGQQQIS